MRLNGGTCLRTLLIATAVFVCSAAIASPGPWFGQPLPPPVDESMRSLIATADSDLPVQPAIFGPGPKSPLLRGDAIKADLEKIVAFSLESKAAGDFLWGRVSGTPAYYHTVSWAVGQLRAAGLKDARLEDFEATLTTPTAGEVRILGDASFGAGTGDVVLRSAMVGGRGPVNGSVNAPMIYVGHGTQADLLGRDVRGKVAVLHTTLNPGTYAADEIGRPGELIKAGAVGVVEILQQPGNMLSYDGDRHGCGTGLCLTVGGGDGYFLENMLGKAGAAGKTVKATLSSVAIERNGLKSANGVATIQGRTDRTIIIEAHADAWFQGADDNAGGLATMLALARYFAKQPKPRHTLVFLISAGHHTPGMGVAEFRLQHEQDIVSRADLIINMEHLATSGLAIEIAAPGGNNFGRPFVTTTTELPKAVAVTNRAPFLIDLWAKGATCFGLATQRIVDRSPPGELGLFILPQRMTQALSPRTAAAFAGLRGIADVPMTQMISAGPFYHTSGEVPDLIPNAGLERAARFHAYLIAASDKADGALLKGAAWKPRPNCPAIP